MTAFFCGPLSGWPQYLACFQPISAADNAVPRLSAVREVKPYRENGVSFPVSLGDDVPAWTSHHSLPLGGRGHSSRSYPGMIHEIHGSTYAWGCRHLGRV